jgi:tetratricopeptide (TPR) repeat protein
LNEERRKAGTPDKQAKPGASNSIPAFLLSSFNNKDKKLACRPTRKALPPLCHLPKSPLSIHFPERSHRMISFRAYPRIAGCILALTLFPSCGKVRSSYEIQRGNEHLKKREWNAAIANYSRAIEFNPEEAAAYNDRGIAKSQNGDITGAISDCTRAIELNPKSFSYYVARGDAKSSKADYIGAIADFDRAITLDPKCMQAYGKRGSAKDGKKDLDGAMADYNRAIELDPNDKEGYIFRGNAKLRRKDYEGAITDLNHAVELAPLNSTRNTPTPS